MKQEWVEFILAILPPSRRPAVPHPPTWKALPQPPPALKDKLNFFLTPSQLPHGRPNPPLLGLPQCSTKTCSAALPIRFLNRPFPSASENNTEVLKLRNNNKLMWCSLCAWPSCKQFITLILSAS